MGVGRGGGAGELREQERGWTTVGEGLLTLKHQFLIKASSVSWLRPSPPQAGGTAARLCKKSAKNFVRSASFGPGSDNSQSNSEQDGCNRASSVYALVGTQVLLDVTDDELCSTRCDDRRCNM
jgi:hypothetical protein